MKKIIVLMIASLLTLANSVNAYTFGLKSQDNTIDNIVNIEDYFKIYTPIVGFIFDPWWEKATINISNLASRLWKSRIYHITVSPNMYSAQQVADWMFDEQYKWFFDQIKKQDIRVIFRTMHEMNWWWYPWASDTNAFKKAWIHIWELSRQQWLDVHNILFDFSINHWDMPSKWAPSQTAELIQCSPKKKAQIKCISFEDYYPWDQYVDLVWVSFYNWGKWNSDRKRLTSDQILNDPDWNTLARMKKLEKPIFIDEVWTTAVNYEWEYDYSKTLENFTKNRDDKNLRLLDFKDFLFNNPEIYGFVYFNVDYTEKLMNRLIWEADWAVINMKTWKVYEKIFTLYNFSENDPKRNQLLNLFDVSAIERYDHTIFVKNSLRTTIKLLDDVAAKKYLLFSQRINWLDKISKKIPSTNLNISTKNQLLEAIEKTKELYSEYVK